MVRVLELLELRCDCVLVAAVCGSWDGWDWPKLDTPEMDPAMYTAAKVAGCDGAGAWMTGGGRGQVAGTLSRRISDGGTGPARLRGALTELVFSGHLSIRKASCGCNICLGNNVRRWDARCAGQSRLSLVKAIALGNGCCSSYLGKP